ncbi:MAG: hypothetical protein C1943_13945 [Halochromatium sp.]|nr:hypothetical protein [Halochromatium sp.]
METPVINLRVIAPDLLLVLLLVILASPAVAEPSTRSISGQLTYMQRIALTPESIAVVEFRANDDQQVQGETRFGSEGRQVPLPFALQIPLETNGQVRGAIWSAGRPRWVTDSVPITAGTDPLEIGTLRLYPFTPAAFTAVMRCGDTEFQIDVQDDQARLHIGGQSFDLFPVAAASGAKFADQDDPGTFFWSKGNSALVSLSGQTLPECVAAVPVEKAPFRARGNEPGWSLEINGDQLQLTLDYGAREIKAKLPSPISIDTAKVYQLPEQNLSLRISGQRCSDTMTGMPYPNRVLLELEDRHLSGCGGEPNALLEGAEWRVRSLAGEPVPDAVAVSISFLEDNRIAGSSGCNRFMGGYELTGEGLSFGQIAGTMMACPELQMQTEQRFLGLLQAVTRFEIPADGQLQLVTSDDQRITAER